LAVREGGRGGEGVREENDGTEELEESLGASAYFPTGDKIVSKEFSKYHRVE